MCFSATASFGVSLVLGLLSVPTFKMVKNKKAYLFALMPFFFALQQFFEGLVWLSFSQPACEMMRTPASYVYLFFALIFWPMWPWYAWYFLEGYRAGKWVRIALLIPAAQVVSELIVKGFPYVLNTTILNGNLVYSSPTWESGAAYAVMYLLAVTLPFTFSKFKYMWVLGLTLAISYSISYYCYYHAMLSVWCYFAAVLSTQVYVITKINRGFGQT